MVKLVCDIETNGLDPDVIHCICIEDLDSDENWQFYGPDLETGLKVIADADETIWHNGIGYDIPAIKKIYPGFQPKGRLTDTLVLSRMMRADIMVYDSQRYCDPNESDVLPRSLFGSHSLRAWGIRMGKHKGDYTGGWDTFNQEMLMYCIQDVKVTKALYRSLQVNKWSQQAIDAEHRCSEICDQIGKYGWTFDYKKASELYAYLAGQRSDLETQLKDLFEPWQIHEWFVPKVNNKTKGYKKGVAAVKTKTVYFNPNSRRHIEHCLRSKYNWKPTFMTAQGHAQIDDKILSELPYPEAKTLSRYFMIQKRISQLAEGKGAWLKKVDDDGKLRHQIISSATVSSRCSHRNPNLGQVPATRLEFGKECRELFTVDDGYTLLGSDLSGLELRCLAHYMNDQNYIDQIEGGDIHTYNQKQADLPTRDAAKRMIYCLIYGGGDAKLGEVIERGASAGKELRLRFMNNLPAYARLKEAITEATSRGYLKALDERRVKIRSKHSALNLLLQSAGACIARQWVINIQNEIEQQALDAHIVAWVHDEVQVAVKKGLEERVGNLIGRMAQKTGEEFNLRIPIKAEYKCGRNWSETH